MPGTLERNMAKKKMGRPPSGRDDVSVKIDRGVVARARFVADHRKQTLAEYVSETLRVAVNREFDRLAKGGAD